MLLIGELGLVYMNGNYSMVRNCASVILSQE